MKKLLNIKYTQFIADLAIFLISALIAARFIRISPQIMVLTAILFSLSGLYVMFLKACYRIRYFSLKDLYLLFEGIVLASIVPAGIILFPDFSENTLKYIVLNIAIITILLLSWRWGFGQFRKKFEQPRSVVIIGKNAAADEICRQITSKAELNLNIADNVSDVKEIDNLKKIDILINATEKDSEQKSFPGNPEIYSMQEIYEKITHKIPVNHLSKEWFQKNFSNIEKPVYKVLKRIFDIGSAVVILLVTFPILLLVALSVKLYDGGPVLYVQNRIGKNAKPFRFYKLRTMTQNAEQAGIVNKTEKEDNRILPVCKIARKARFDEIPQMINILKGDMSIVGPRAEFEDFVREYEKQIPFYQYRHSTIPGWTGWAQINQGHCVSVEDVTEKLRYDLYYIKHRNLFWDFSILLRAVFLALSGRHG